MGRRWSKSEIAIIRNHYPTDCDMCFCLLSGRTKNSVVQQAYQLDIKCNAWTSDEIQLLKIYYPHGGSILCVKFINRSKCSIRNKACEIGLPTTLKNGKSSARKILSVVRNNVVICFCHKHGEAEHRTRPGRSSRCSMCRAEYIRTEKTRLLNRKSEKKRLREPCRLYSHRLRVLLRMAIRNKQVGCFRFLPYSPTDLRKHLDDIKESQNNCCPSCSTSYDISGFHIDHIVPLASARTDTEVLALFGLKNLSLLCGSCNCSKGQSLMTGGV